MAVVTVASAIERALGFIYRVYLSRALGAEGVGIYQISVSVIGLIMTLTSSGIPITVSRIMTKHSAAREGARNYKTFTAGVILSIIASAPIVFALTAFGNFFSFIFTDKRCMSVLTIMLPGVIITSVYAVIRGYFWGEKKFFTYSAIELLEEAVMLIAGIILINNAVSAEVGAKRAGLAVLISYAFSFAAATIVYFMHGGKLKSPKGELKPLISSAAPITLMRTGGSLINTLIAVVLPARLLLYGLTGQEAMSDYGVLSGMVIPLIYIPSTLIGSIALVLVPELADNFYRNNHVTLKNNVEKAVKVSVFISALIIPSFLSLGKNIGQMVYGNAAAGIYLRAGALIMFPMSISLITTSMLNSLNLEKKTMLSFFAGAIPLLLCVYFLSPVVGVYSLITGLTLSYTITATINLILIKKTCKVKPRYVDFIIASFVFLIPSTLFGYLLNNVLGAFMPYVLSTVIAAAAVTAFTYAFFTVFNLIDLKDLFKKA